MTISMEIAIVVAGFMDCVDLVLTSCSHRVGLVKC